MEAKYLFHLCRRYMYNVYVICTTGLGIANIKSDFLSILFPPVYNVVSHYQFVCVCFYEILLLSFLHRCLCLLVVKSFYILTLLGRAEELASWLCCPWYLEKHTRLQMVSKCRSTSNLVYWYFFYIYLDLYYL